MDGERFDRLARTMAAGASRRRVLGTMAAAAGVLLGRAGAGAQFHPGPVRLVCGGFADVGCPSGMTCVYPADACDLPSLGCEGLCLSVTVTGPGPSVPASPCSTIRCMSGTHCCDVCGGVCVDQDVNCAAVDCRPDDDGTDGEPCGVALCGEGEYCCNASCSRCVPNGQGCTRELCGPPDGGVVCDQNVCEPGEVCCPGGCGICTPFGGACPAIACLPRR